MTPDRIDSSTSSSLLLSLEEEAMKRNNSSLDKSSGEAAAEEEGKSISMVAAMLTPLAPKGMLVELHLLLTCWYVRIKPGLGLP